MIQREHILQRHIRAFVREAVAAPHEFFAFDRAKPTSKFSHLRQRARGVQAGTPDTLLFCEGAPPIWAELKAPGKAARADERQIIVGERLRDLGHVWVCCNSVTEYMGVLVAAGIALHPNALLIAADHQARVEGVIARAEMKKGKAPKAEKPAPKRRQASKAWVKRTGLAGIVV